MLRRLSSDPCTRLPSRGCTNAKSYVRALAHRCEEKFERVHTNLCFAGNGLKGITSVCAKGEASRVDLYGLSFANSCEDGNTNVYEILTQQQLVG